MTGRRLLWVDGVCSVVMAKIVLQYDPDAEPVHCDLGSSVHEDSHRFIDDAERWLGKPVTRLRSREYANIDEVFEKRRYLSGPKGAPCTGEMKFVPRLNYQLPSDTHFWGYTADKRDARRFRLMLEKYPDLAQRAPLFDLGLTKADTHRQLADAGVKRPYVYEIGYPNGNCLGCSKASSPRYWSATREYFPEVFARRADQSRRFGAKLAVIKGRRVYLDEIPEDYPRGLRGVEITPCGPVCDEGSDLA